MPRPKPATPPTTTTFRLRRPTLDLLDRIAAEQARRTGSDFPNRTAALDWAARELAARLDHEAGPITTPGREG